MPGCEHLRDGFAIRVSFFAYCNRLNRVGASEPYQRPLDKSRPCSERYQFGEFHFWLSGREIGPDNRHDGRNILASVRENFLVRISLERPLFWRHFVRVNRAKQCPAHHIAADRDVAAGRENAGFVLDIDIL